MPSGGKRSGAGRPKGSHKLSFMQKLNIGAQCERLRAVLIEESTSEQLARKTANVRKVWDYAQSIPVNERHDWLASDEFEGEPEDASEANYLDKVRKALQLDQGLVTDLDDDPNDPDSYFFDLDPDPEPSRVISISTKRLMGVRDDIKASVAAECGLTIQQVDQCWRHFTKIEEDLESKD